MKKVGHIIIWTTFTDHRLRFFKNPHAIGVRFYRFCISWVW